MSDSVLETKIYVPPPRANLVERPELHERLLSGLRDPGSFALLSAPAGFGKTTLLACFVALLPKTRPSVAWVTLDREDNYPRRFWIHLIAALTPALGEEIQSAVELLDSPQPLPPDTLPTFLINKLAGSASSVILVLDDYHEIEEQPIHDGLLYLLDHLPGNLYVVIATRVDPPWPLSRFRAGNRLLEIRVNDLRFDIEAARGFMRRTMGLDLSDEAIAILESKTEGWIAGLQLAALSLQRGGDVTAFLGDFAGSHTYVAEYLIEEVMRRQTTQVQEFLLRSSILEKMNADLCDAVTECPNGKAILEELYRDNVFIVPLDNKREWFRYHRLFCDLLRVRLGQDHDETFIRKLHHRASLWYEQHGFVADAVNHALKETEFERVAKLVIQSARKMIFNGQVSTLRSWLQSLPETSFRLHPELSFFLFWTDALQNRADLSEVSIRSVEERLDALPSTPETDQLHGELIAVVCRAVALSGRTAEGIRLAKKALPRLSPGDLASRARVNSALSVAHALEGRMEVAEDAFRECRSQAITAGDYRLAAHATMAMGLLQIDYGRLRAAATTFQSILEMSVQAAQQATDDRTARTERQAKSATAFYPAGQGHIGLGIVEIEWNELKAAERHLLRGIELCRLGGLEGIYVARMQMSRLRQASGDFGGAFEEVLRLKEVSPRLDDFRVITRQIQLQLAAGNVADAWRLAAPYAQALAADGGAPDFPLIFREQVQTIVARVYLAQGKADKALLLMDDLRRTAEPAGRLRPLIETHLLTALARRKQNDERLTPEAIESMRLALQLGEPERFLQLYREEGQSMIPLLKAVIKIESASDKVKLYAKKILQSFGSPIETDEPAPRRRGSNSIDLVEQPTPREIEVLQLLAAGDSNQNIADKLYISVRTVKKHTSNIYAKLGAMNRTQAVAIARRYGLLSAD